MGLFLLELFNGALSASQALMGLCLLTQPLLFNGAPYYINITCEKMNHRSALF